MEKVLNIRDILKQLVDLKMECEDKKRTIQQIEKDLNEMEEGGYKEIDSVTGGSGGTQHYKIEGFPYPRYSKMKTTLLIRKRYLAVKLSEIEEHIRLAEEFINKEHDDSRMRRLLTYRFVEGLTWVQVAHRMGGQHTEESSRKTVERYLNI